MVDDDALLNVQHDEAENIGYVIPQPVIEHFISDFERNKKYTAFPLLGIEWQKTENPYLRKSLGMKVKLAQHSPPHCLCLQEPFSLQRCGDMLLL